MIETAADLHARLAGVEDPLTLLESMFALAPFGIQLFDGAGRSILTNAAFRAMFGSAPPPEYCIFEDNLLRDRGILALVRRAYAGELIATPPVWYDVRELTNIAVTEGARIATAAWFVPVRDRAGAVTHVAFMFKDVTAELSAREAAEAARASAERERDVLRAILEQSGDGILVADAAGVLRLFNPAAQRQHGLSDGDLALDVPASAWTATFGLRDLSGAPLASDATPLFRAVRGEVVRDARWIVVRPDGEERTLQGTATPLRGADGAPAGGVLVARDVTDQQRLEDALRAAVALRDEFLSIASHELKTPLSAMELTLSGVLRAAQTGRPDAVPAERLLRLQHQLDRLNRLVNQLLDVSRIAAGRLALEPREHDVVQIVAAAIERFAEQAQRAGSTIALRSTGPATALVDDDRLDQVVTNLVGNALKFGAGRPIDVDVEAGADEVRILVTDQGPGIAAEEQARIFERFERAASARNYGGMGLGLWIARQIVEAHGGRIAVASAAGAGAAFTVALPRR